MSASKRNLTELMHACLYDIERAKHLIETSSDNELNCKSKTKGMTALMYACNNKKGKIVIEMLLERKVLLDTVDNENRTAFMHTLYYKNRNLEFAKMLANAGANLDTIITIQISPFGWSPYECCFPRKRTYLMIACQQRYEDSIELAEFLIEMNANVNFTDKCGITPLILASSNKNNYAEKLVGLLLEAGANPNHASDHDCTPLFVTQNPKIAKLLIESGANVNFEDSLGETALWSAFNNLELAKVFVEAGVNIVHTNIYNKSIFDVIDLSQPVREYLLSKLNL